jgi:hypothetical protein
MWSWPKGKPRGPLSPEHLVATRRKAKPQPQLAPVVAACAAVLRRCRRAAFGHGAGLRYVPEASLIALAERLTLNEPAGDPKVPQVRADLARMIFNRRRLDWTKGWRVERITAAIPETWERRVVVAECFNITEKLLGPVERQSFSVVRLIELCAQLETAAAFENYVAACLRQAKRRSKLVSAIISQQAFDYWQNTKEKDVWQRGLNAYGTPEQNKKWLDEFERKIAARVIRADFRQGEQEKNHANKNLELSSLTPEQEAQRWRELKEKEYLAAIGTVR